MAVPDLYRDASSSSFKCISDKSTKVWWAASRNRLPLSVGEEGRGERGTSLVVLTYVRGCSAPRVTWSCSCVWPCSIDTSFSMRIGASVASRVCKSSNIFTNESMCGCSELARICFLNPSRLVKTFCKLALSPWRFESVVRLAAVAITCPNNTCISFGRIWMSR